MKIGVISDIHANIFALENVLKELKASGVTKTLVAGDLIGYYYWPKEVVSRLMEDDDVICISGNHENLLKRSLKSTEDASIYKKKYGSGFEVCKDELTSTQMNWLLSLPDSLTVSFNGISFFLSHGSLNSIDEYIYPDTQNSILDLNYSTSDFTIFGNTHYPFIRFHRNKYLINPGSVGQPRDVSALSSFVVINTENFSVQFNRAKFDVDQISKKIKELDPKNEYLRKVLTR